MLIYFCREIINGFVNDRQDMLREQLFKRLEILMNLQGEYVQMVAMLDIRYQPPPCYFHYFPVPQFHRKEMKMGKKKKGKKGKIQNKKSKDKNKDDDEEEVDSLLLDSSLNNSIISMPEWQNWESGSELTFKNPAYFRKMDTKVRIKNFFYQSCFTCNQFFSLTFLQINIVKNFYEVNSTLII